MRGVPLDGHRVFLPALRRAVSPEGRTRGQEGDLQGATCRKIITVPEPGPEPAAPVRRSAEELAAVALADEPKAVAEAVVEIALVCKHCDFPFTVEPARAGKNVPCPDCTRINRVPIPSVEKSGNWPQTGEHLPRLARRDNEPVLEGAWKGGDTGYVAPESIQAAGAGAKIEYEPLSLAVKIKRIMLGVGLIGGLIFGIVYLSRTRSEIGREVTLEQAIQDRRGWHQAARTARRHPSARRRDSVACLYRCQGPRCRVGRSAPCSLGRCGPARI